MYQKPLVVFFAMKWFMTFYKKVLNKNDECILTSFIDERALFHLLRKCPSKPLTPHTYNLLSHHTPRLPFLHDCQPTVCCVYNTYQHTQLTDARFVHGCCNDWVREYTAWYAICSSVLHPYPLHNAFPPLAAARQLDANASGCRCQQELNTVTMDDERAQASNATIHQQEKKTNDEFTYSNSSPTPREGQCWNKTDTSRSRGGAAC